MNLVIILKNAEKFFAANSDILVKRTYKMQKVCQKFPNFSSIFILITLELYLIMSILKELDAFYAKKNNSIILYFEWKIIQMAFFDSDTTKLDFYNFELHFIINFNCRNDT